MQARTTTAPLRPAVNLAEAVRHLRVSDEDEYSDIEERIAAATTDIELECSRALITQTVTMTWDLDEFQEEYEVHEAIYIPRAPLQSITSFKTFDTDGNETVLVEDTDFEISSDLDPARIIPIGGGWSPTRRHAAVEIVAVCGYGDYQSSVPRPLRAAIMKFVDDLYQERGDFVTGTIVTSLPRGVEELIARYKLFTLV